MPGNHACSRTRQSSDDRPLDPNSGEFGYKRGKTAPWKPWPQGVLLFSPTFPVSITMREGFVETTGRNAERQRGRSHARETLRVQSLKHLGQCFQAFERDRVRAVELDEVHVRAGFDQQVSQRERRRERQDGILATVTLHDRDSF